MRRAVPLLKNEPLVVQKRLPSGVRKQAQRQKLFNTEGPTTIDAHKTPGIVVEIAQAARKRDRDRNKWANLLDQALESHAELSAKDMAGVLWSMSEARFRHDGVIDEFVRSLRYQANVSAMVTAILAVDRLGFSTEALRTPFVQQLGGSCDKLGFADLRRVLMAFARCWQASRVDPQLLEELCNCIVERAATSDPRNLIAVPQHLGRLRFPHPMLTATASSSIATVIASRLTVAPLDVLRALDGFLLLVPLLTDRSQEKIALLGSKCSLLAARLFSDISHDELWRLGAQVFAAEIVDHRVWCVWTEEMASRRAPGQGSAQHLAGIRKRIMRQWNVQGLPSGLEMALRSAV